MKFYQGAIVAIQADSVLDLHPLNDGTLRLAREAQRRGAKTFFYEVCNLSLNKNQVVAYGKFIELDDDYKIETSSDLIRFNLADACFLLIRQNPPFNMAYITVTYILDHLPQSVCVLNPTQALRNVSEKSAVMHLDSIMPTLISGSIKEIVDFSRMHGGVVLKPLYSFGGQDVVLLQMQEAGFIEKLESYVGKHDEPIMVQPYCAEVKNGEKRIVWIKDQWVGAFLKIPHQDDFRANTVHYATVQPYSLTNHDLQCLAQLADYLKENHIFFAGIDMIGPYINEVNVTSVGAFVPFNQTNHVPLEQLFWDAALSN